METFIKNIKNCFDKHINNITNHKKHNKKIKINLNNLVLYEFLNTFYSKEESTEKTNDITNVEYSRSSYYKQNNQINLEFFQQLSLEISSICNKVLFKNDKHRYTFIAVDGTYSNGINYSPSLNMGYFDIFNNIPIEITFEGVENRNKEVACLIKKIQNDINYFTNKVIVVDRLYFTYDFIYFLIKNNIKFIIRCKGDCKNLKLEKITKDKKLIKLIKNNTRIVYNYDTINKTISVPNKSKKEKNHKTIFNVNIKNDCTIITNLSKHFSNNNILNIYKSRWNIETYFKLVKHNFNFQHLTNKKEGDIKKKFLCINIICSICKVLDYFLAKTKRDDNNALLDDIIIKCNETKLLRFFENIFLKELIISNKGNFEDYNKNINQKLKKYISIRKYKKNESNPRQCKTPFLKWYIKAYSNQGELTKILRAIENDDIESLNSNLKSKAEKIVVLSKIYE